MTAAAAFVVLENHDPAQVRQVAERVAANNGSELVAGFRPSVEPGPRRRAVRVGRVADPVEASQAVLAAVGGASLVIDAAAADRDVIDRLCDDLRHLGTLDHRVEPHRDAPLDDVQRQLLGLLMGGSTLGQAARALHLSRRTADRRLAAARQALEARTTSEAVITARHLGVQPVEHHV